MIEKRKRKNIKEYRLDIHDTNPDINQRLNIKQNVEIIKVFPSIKTQSSKNVRVNFNFKQESLILM